MGRELDNISINCTMKWMKPGVLSILPKGTKIVPVTLNLNYKRNQNAKVQENNVRYIYMGN